MTTTGINPVPLKGKGKVLPRTGHEGTEGEYRYSSTLSLTSALDGGGSIRYPYTNNAVTNAKKLI
jgi:hypothetical protein